MQKLQAHPWHGVSYGKEMPKTVTAFIEVVPSDSVKFEIDKETGHLIVDRPQKYSNFCPALYGFVTQTYCGPQVALRAKREGIKGDGDPLDILVLTENEISHGAILVRAKPVGGIRMIDRDEVDDKIIAVLENDTLYGAFENIDQLPTKVVDRLRHYFLTYKDMPGSGEKKRVEIAATYSVEEAYQVINASICDYTDKFRT
jgi:inorganic pyrophosphatase